MADRYQSLYRLQPNLYLEGCPVIIVAGALLKDTVTEKVLAQKLEVDESVIIPLARSAVKTLREVNWIKVEISDKMRNVAAELERVISEAKPNQRIEVEVRRDAPEGTCVVSTAPSMS